MQGGTITRSGIKVGLFWLMRTVRAEVVFNHAQNIKLTAILAEE